MLFVRTWPRWGSKGGKGASRDARVRASCLSLCNGEEVRDLCGVECKSVIITVQLD